MERQPSLRSGYSTGACATAATRGALLALIAPHLLLYPR